MVDVNLESEESRVYWVCMNAWLNGNEHETYRLTQNQSLESYDYYEEAMSWARSKNYFPDMTDKEILSVLEKYEVWNTFVEAYGKDKK